MTYRELRERVPYNIFNFHEVKRNFPNEKGSTIKVQLSRMTAAGSLIRLKREWYAFWQTHLDPREIASIIFPNTCLSVESVLIRWGILDAAKSQITIISPISSFNFTLEINNQNHQISCSKVKPPLFVSKKTIYSGMLRRTYSEATPEKALLDWLYLRKPDHLSIENLNFEGVRFNESRYFKLLERYPKFVQEYMIF